MSSQFGVHVDFWCHGLWLYRPHKAATEYSDFPQADDAHLHLGHMSDETQELTTVHADMWVQPKCIHTDNMVVR